MSDIYDLIIIGAGPAGLTASIYASRYKLKNLVLGKIFGGTITLAHKVENYPGFEEISGFELGQKMVNQARKLGAEILQEEVEKIEKDNNLFKVLTIGGKEFQTKTVVIAAGTQRRKLEVPGEEEYLGKGVSYCTSCDAPFYKDKIVALIGGSNAAVGGAVHTAEFAKKVFIIYRKNELRADPAWVAQASANPKIEVIYNTNVTEILGDGTRVVGVKLDNPYQGKEILPLDGVFVEIGGIPAGEFLNSLGVEKDENGLVKVNQNMETNIPGVFAAGDVTTHSLVMSQVIVACADGAIAAQSAYKYLKNFKF